MGVYDHTRFSCNCTTSDKSKMQSDIASTCGSHLNEDFASRICQQMGKINLYTNFNAFIRIRDANSDAFAVCIACICKFKGRPASFLEIGYKEAISRNS